MLLFGNTAVIINPMDAYLGLELTTENCAADPGQCGILRTFLLPKQFLALFFYISRRIFTSWAARCPSLCGDGSVAQDSHSPRTRVRHLCGSSLGHSAPAGAVLWWGHRLLPVGWFTRVRRLMRYCFKSVINTRVEWGSYRCRL